MTHSLIRTVLGAAAAALFAVPAIGAAADLTPQQERMKTCSAQNKGKKGDDYKKAQSACLSGTETAAAAPMTPQERMKMCSAKNKGKKGDDYKTAQSECLKG